MGWGGAFKGGVDDVWVERLCASRRVRMSISLTNA